MDTNSHQFGGNVLAFSNAQDRATLFEDDSIPPDSRMGALACRAGDVRHVFIARSAGRFELGAIPIDYQHVDFVKEIHRLTSESADVVFDGIGGTHMWRSRGKVVVYGLTSSLRGGRLASGRSGRRRRYRAIAIFGVYIVGGWVLPGRKRVIPYSIQTLKRLRPELFRQDRVPCLSSFKSKRSSQTSRNGFLLPRQGTRTNCSGKGGVTGKIVLVRNRSSLESGAA